MDNSTKERINKIDEEITELRSHAIMRARAGGRSNQVIDTLERVKELELEKEDLINGTNKLAQYKKEKRIRNLKDEIEQLKALKKEVNIFKKKQYDSKIEDLEKELRAEEKETYSR